MQPSFLRHRHQTPANPMHWIRHKKITHALRNIADAVVHRHQSKNGTFLKVPPRSWRGQDYTDDARSQKLLAKANVHILFQRPNTKDTQPFVSKCRLKARVHKGTGRVSHLGPEKSISLMVCHHDHTTRSNQCARKVTPII